MHVGCGWQGAGWRTVLRAALLGLLCCDGVLAQDVYRAVDADGTPSYSDRPPNGSPAELVRSEAPPGEAVGIELYERSRAAGIVLIAENRFFGPVQIAIYPSAADYAVRSEPLFGLPVLPARRATQLGRVSSEAQSASRRSYYVVHIPGDPRARHAPVQPYRLPYGVASRHLVSQAYPEQITHTDPSSEHAIDFEMPVGTGVHAARAGIVIEVAGDYFRSATDPTAGAAPANLVRILHDDGTMAVYAHLSLHSVRVTPGQRVERGERIADSGNTGFSTGPHLHFVVQRNSGGAIVSVPVQFAAADGSPLDVHSGDEPTAY